MSDLTLNRPVRVEDPSWAAITATIERLGRASGAGDLSQTVGVAKELVESVAGNVLAVRGEVVAENASFTSVVAKAYEVLERQPGKGLTQAEPLRSVMQNTKAMDRRTATDSVRAIRLTSSFSPGCSNPPQTRPVTV